AKCRRRGQNKHRDSGRLDDDVRICNDVLLGRECSKGPKCSMEHDLHVYLASKGEDLGPRCQLFDVYGYCKFSYKCRYARAHTGPDGKMITDEAKVAEVGRGAHLLAPTVTRDFQKSVRNKTLPLPKSELYEAFLDIAKAEREKQAEAKKKEAEEVAAEAEAKRVLLAEQPKKPKLDWKGKTYLAPLTTVGNLPFRRICKEFGVDITCGEMAMCSNLISGQQHEWALTRRHHTEDIFGIQIAGSHPSQVVRTCEAISLNDQLSIDFVDLNLGCPVDSINSIGAGSALLERKAKLYDICAGANYALKCPLTVKMRMGIFDGKNTAHKLIPLFKEIGVSAITLHGRSKQQRYTKRADWSYIERCAEIAAGEDIAFFGNGDCLSHEEYMQRLETANVSGIMIGRGALIKPWIFKEIKDRQVYDIRSGERLDMLKRFVNYGLEHWGTDTVGVNQTRRYLCEWMSFLYRYVPVGLLEVLPQRMNDRPLPYYGRDDLETLMGSPNAADWIKLTELLLGPAPENFKFTPK
ncbi:hypothetical protein BDK51DRAFT_15089, partial [Blyttiomyces helicus]